MNRLDSNGNHSYENFAFYDNEDGKKAVTVIDGDRTSLDRTEIAVQIKDVTLSYGRHKVLDGINMNVPIKKIYGLLGPSGCGMYAKEQWPVVNDDFKICLQGKTSLLRCVVGIRQPNSGSISVYGHTPGTPESGIPGPGLGYTPQVCLVC